MEIVIVKEGTNMIATLQTSFLIYLSVSVFVVFTC